MHVAIPGASTGLRQGADGQAASFTANGRLVLRSAFEEGGALGIAEQDAVDPWAFTYDMVGGMPGVEDAKPGDFDGDGKDDSVLCADAGARLWFVFNDGAHAYSTPVAITSSLSHGHWMQAVAVDVDGDGLLDVVAGSRSVNNGIGANHGIRAWFRNPGGGSKRDGSAWTMHLIDGDSDAGWIMSLQVIDPLGAGVPSFFWTDRRSFKDPVTGATVWSKYGASWDETTRGPSGPTFVHHQIEQAGSCGTCTPGDAMMGVVTTFNGQPAIVDGTSTLTTPNRVAIHSVTSWTAPAPWSTVLLPSSIVNANVGHFQSAAVADFDRNGYDDVAIAFWETDDRNADSTASGIITALQQPDGSFLRGEVSGPNGTKFDNLTIVDANGDGYPDIAASEQNYDETRPDHVGGIGVEVFENRYAPASIDGAVDGPPDAAVDAPPDACGGAH